jgi:hypothetical protein
LTTLTLTPVTVRPGGAEFLAQESSDKVQLETGSGFVLMEVGGLSFDPVSSVSLTLTPA